MKKRDLRKPDAVRREAQNNQAFFPAPTLSNDEKLEYKGFLGAIPERYICPLSLVIMTDPVYDRAAPSIKFERNWIEESLVNKKQNPCTRGSLTPEHLVSDDAQRREIRAFVKAICHPSWPKSIKHCDSPVELPNRFFCC